MMSKIEKLLDLTIAYLERELNPLVAVTATATATATEPKAPRKPRAVKANDPVPASAPAEHDPMMGVDAPVAATATANREMSEAESATEVQNAAKAIVQRFPNPGAENRPEGFHLAKKLLTEKFRVARITDLVHAQRLAFIAEVRTIIAAADAKVPAGAGV